MSAPFDVLFGDMGPAYTAVVRAQLQLKAEAGNPDAAHLLGHAAPETPDPGDVVLAKDHVWTWDSPDGQAWGWWSPQLRQSADLEDFEPVIWHGRLVSEQVLAKARELQTAMDWMLGHAVLCGTMTNAKTGARFYRPLGVDSIETLLELYRNPPGPEPDPPQLVR